MNSSIRVRPVWNLIKLGPPLRTGSTHAKNPQPGMAQIEGLIASNVEITASEHSLHEAKNHLEKVGKSRKEAGGRASER